MSKPPHNPAEIFGFPPDNNSVSAIEARRKYWCPFIDKFCPKKSRLLVYPLGVCSVWHQDHAHVVCPNRFRFGTDTLLREVGKLFCDKGKGQQYGLVPEVRLPKFGNVDWVVFARNKGGSITNFCGIETAANDTTQTGQLVNAVKDFMEKKRLKKQYRYGLNTYNAVKLSFVQIMNKGQVFESWERKYVWILQDRLFEDLTKRFGLEIEKSTDRKKFIILYVVKLEENKTAKIFNIKLSETYATSVEDLSKAYQRKLLPSPDKFIQGISAKLAKEGQVTYFD